MRGPLCILACCALISARPATGDAPVLLPVPSDPTISFMVWFKTGSQNDPEGKEGLAYLTAQMLADASTQNNPYEAILKKLYPLAANYNVRVDREMITLFGRTHKDNLDAFYTLFEDAYARPAFKQEDFNRIKSNTLDYLEKTLRYASDEELGKAALYHFVFDGTPYRHPPQGTVEGLRAITLDDVRAFYQSYFNRENAVVALGGGYSDGLVKRFQASLALLPEGKPVGPPAVKPQPVRGLEVLLIDKPGADASISFGFPITARRGERDFYALWLATSWLGEHRNSASHLFQVIREKRGLNYGDYAYIEAFPEGGIRTKPPANVARRHQLFEIWIRTLPDQHAHFALRAAARELKVLVDNGMSEENFNRTKAFLTKYGLHFAETTMERLGYAVDDAFYGVEGSHLQRFREIIPTLTREEVNAAVKKYLQYDNMKIAIVTGQAQTLKDALATDAPSPITYEAEKGPEVLEEDRHIQQFPLKIKEENIRTVPVDQFLQR